MTRRSKYANWAASLLRNIADAIGWRSLPVTRKALLVSHEMSLTGAPRALLNLAVELKKEGVTPVFLSIADGKLKRECKALNISYKIITSMTEKGEKGENTFHDYVSQFDFVLFNTLATVPMIESIKTVNVKKYCWIHEGILGFDVFGSNIDLTYYFSLYDKVFIVGDYAKRIAKEYTNDAIELTSLLYGMDDYSTIPQRKEPHGKFRMLFVAPVEKRKGHDILLDALPFIPCEIIDDIEIIIAGPTYHPDIEDRIRDSDYGCIKRVGLIEHDEVLRLFYNSDILICPSIDDPMPIVCTEAMIFSKPVLVSDHTGTASFVNNGENGYVVKCNNPQALADAIAKAYKNRDGLEEMGRKSRLIFEQNFTNKIFNDNIKKYILNDFTHYLLQK